MPGTYVNVALSATKRAKGWIWNDQGQIGDGTNTNRATPVYSVGGHEFIKLTCDGTSGQTAAFSAGIKADGSLWTWGHNEWGRLGLGDTTNRNIPTRSESAPFCVDVAAGIGNISVLDQDGRPWVCGRDIRGVLGRAVVANRPTFAPIPDNSRSYKRVFCGGYRVFALDEDDALWGWGDGQNGALAVSTGNTNILPISCASGIQVRDVSAVGSASGATYWPVTAILDVDGKVWCSGYGLQGCMGNGDLVASNPVPVAAIVPACKSISVGMRHVFAIDLDGRLWAWGLGSNNSLGDGDFSVHIVSTPIEIPMPEPLEQVMAGVTGGIGLTKSGRIYSIGTTIHGLMIQDPDRYIALANHLPMPEVHVVSKVNGVSYERVSNANDMLKENIEEIGDVVPVIRTE